MPHSKWDGFTHGKPVNRRGLITAAADGEYEPYQGKPLFPFHSTAKEMLRKSLSKAELGLLNHV